MANKEVEIECTVIRRSIGAYLINDGDNEEWIPLSQITDEDLDEYDKGTVTMTEWIALEKGLI